MIVGLMWRLQTLAKVHFGSGWKRSLAAEQALIIETDSFLQQLPFWRTCCFHPIKCDRILKSDTRSYKMDDQLQCYNHQLSLKKWIWGETNRRTWMNEQKVGLDRWTVLSCMSWEWNWDLGVSTVVPAASVKPPEHSSLLYTRVLWQGAGTGEWN